MKLNIDIDRITDDPTHPFPWRWRVDQTIKDAGLYTQEGLGSSEKDAVDEAKTHFEQWIKDKRTQRSTRKTYDLEIDMDALL